MKTIPAINLRIGLLPMAGSPNNSFRLEIVDSCVFQNEHKLIQLGSFSPPNPKVGNFSTSSQTKANQIKFKSRSLFHSTKQFRSKREKQKTKKKPYFRDSRDIARAISRPGEAWRRRNRSRWWQAKELKKNKGNHKRKKERTDQEIKKEGKNYRAWEGTW